MVTVAYKDDIYPYPEMRERQVDVIQEIINDWDKYEVFIIEAPTGVGKSGISVSLANYAGSSYVLTSTKLLQDQYEREFSSHVRNVKGKANYDCAINPFFTVETSPCSIITTQRDHCYANGICPYHNAKVKAIHFKNMATSYSYFLTSVESGPLRPGSYPADNQYQRKRGVIICDEGHELTDILTDFSSTTIDPEELITKHKVEMKRLTFKNNRNDNITLINETYLAISERIAAIDRVIESTQSNIKRWFGENIEKASKDAASQVGELVRARKELDHIGRRINWFRERSNDTDWLITPSHDAKTLKIAPVRPEKVFRDYVRPMGHKIVMMSATMGSPNVIMSELGISPSEAKIISTDSPFDAKKSPIHVMPYLDLSFRHIDANLSNVVEVIEDILARHPNEKGIIHSGNYKVNKAILERTSLASRQRLIGKVSSVGSSNELMVEEHSQSAKPTVLVSPSMYTGVDLVDDLSRFQIIVKLPWLNTSDAMVKYKMEAYKDWYANEMIKKLVQSCGRSTRSEEDYCETYIFDSSFTRTWNMNRRLFPEWFAERVIFE